MNQKEHAISIAYDVTKYHFTFLTMIILMIKTRVIDVSSRW